MIGMLPECRRPNLVFQHLPGAVENDPQPFFYNLLLGLELIFREYRVTHSAGFDVERDLPTIRSKREVIRSEVQPGECVVCPAVQLRREIYLSLCVLVCPLKE